MITINDQNNSNIVETVAEGKLDEQNYEKLIPTLENKIKNFGKISWYFEVNNFDGWTVKALWEDAKFDIKHRNDFEKIAIVGNKKWQEWMTEILKPFTDADIKYFDSESKEAAKQWIKV